MSNKFDHNYIMLDIVPCKISFTEIVRRKYCLLDVDLEIDFDLFSRFFRHLYFQLAYRNGDLYV